jgi:hypothetical protein
MSDKIPTPQEVINKAKEVPVKVQEAAPEVAQKSLSGLRSLVAGGVGGICAVVVGTFYISDITGRHEYSGYHSEDSFGGPVDEVVTTV